MLPVDPLPCATARDMVFGILSFKKSTTFCSQCSLLLVVRENPGMSVYSFTIQGLGQGVLETEGL